MKNKIKEILTRWLREDFDNVADSQEMLAAALGVGNATRIQNIKTDIQDLYDQFVSDRQAVEGASDTAELKVVMKPILQRRPDGADWRNMLGAGNEIEVD